ncbi:MAG: restriction endonuclease subunit S [Verrucomicrobiota bacterium]|jgi:type I restriction enzyme S subunit
MGSEWSTVKLEEIAQVLLGKMLDQRKNRGDYLPYLANTNVRWGEFDLTDLRTMRFEGHERDRYSIKSGDILMCEGGEPGRCALWKGDGNGMMYQKALHRIRPNEGIDNRFLYHALFHGGRTEAFSPFCTGTTIKHLPLQNLLQIRLQLPPLPEQRAIAHILGTLDDKIECNRRMNETLEKMAQAIFKSWFVDFDPVRWNMDAKNGKAAGKPPVPPEILKLFPDSFQESELGLIPKGWEVRPFGSFLRRLPVGEKYNQKTVQVVGRIPVLDQGKSGIIGYHNDKPGVMASVDSPIGVFANHTCYMRLISFPFSTIQNVIPFVGNGVNTIWAFFASFGKQSFIEYKGHWPDFVIHKTQVPTEIISVSFANTIYPLLKRIWMGEKEREILAAFRDTLLPKLISGELRIKDAEKFIEALS